MTINVERAAVEIAANVTGTRDVTGLTGAMVDLKAATAQLNREQAAYLKSLATSTAQFGLSKSALLEQKAAMLGIGAAASPMISALKEMGVDGEHSFKAMITQGGVFRELLVLMHESLIMGNWSRFGGSLMVLAERMEVAPMLFTLLGAAALGSAAGLAAFAAALIMGERESTRFANAISSTGGMAGITEAQFRQMAAEIGNDVPGGATKGRNALMDLIATGQFSGETLLAVGRAATEFATYSGQSAADVVKNFTDMKNNAAGWAEKMNESYHFLSESQYEYIQQLQDQGQTEKAEQVAANDLFQSLADNGTHNLGILERAWDGVTNAVRGTFSAMEDIGRASTLEDRLFQLTATMHSTRGDRTQINGEIADIQKQISDQQAAATAKSQNDQKQQLGISADNDLNQMMADLLPGPDIVKAKIAKLKQDIAQALAADPQNKQALYDQSILPQTEAAIEKKYGNRNMPTDGAGAPLNKPDRNGYVIGSDDPAKLQTQASYMESYATATHQAELAVLKLMDAQGRLKGFTPAQISELRTRAGNDDSLAAARASTQVQDTFESQMGGLNEKTIDLTTQISQMDQYGKYEKTAELNAINLEIAQGKLKGLPQSEIDSLRQAATAYDDLTKKADAITRTASYGTQEAFSDYVKQATDAGAHMKQVWTDTFNGMENILVTALSGGKVNFAEFANSVIQDLLKMEVEQNILGPLISMLGGVGGGTNGSGLFKFATSFLRFADGGIMTSGGSIPLHRYANGGVASSPQLAMFGEGRGPEAYVPLPDGRSIPVSMKGGGGGGTMVSNTFNIQSDGSTSGDSQKNASSMSRAITYTIQQELIRQKQDGGIL